MGADGLMFPKPVLEKKKPKQLARRSGLKPKKRYQYRPKKVEKTESVLQLDKSYCYLCKKRGQYGLNALEEHHVFENSGRRSKSEQHGLKVYLCGITCHREGPNSVQKNKEVDLMLKRIAQRKFEETHSRAEWKEESNGVRMDMI